ncbi:MAG: T9SS type A sorting domain-containing protein, partial [Candidatus Marinimicrobia bacterium]|nr:T9SS type A sorting domain-containing protein [Candidatus Neomarinimicrobiota bacterium]
NWEIFTRIDKDVPGGAHVGNIHFPPNGQSDYDYGNTRSVVSFADNWERYPILLDQTRTVTCSEWGCPPQDSHLGFMRWWFSHLPRFTGVTDGILNNWWHYIVDYEGAVEKALSIDGEEYGFAPALPDIFALEQNYPNPFNPITTIGYDLSRGVDVTMTIYNLLGQEVTTLVKGFRAPGRYTVRWDASAVSSGVYFIRLQAGSYSSACKMAVIK